MLGKLQLLNDTERYISPAIRKAGIKFSPYALNAGTGNNASESTKKIGCDILPRFLNNAYTMGYVSEPKSGVGGYSFISSYKLYLCY